MTDEIELDDGQVWNSGQTELSCRIPAIFLDPARMLRDMDLVGQWLNNERRDDLAESDARDSEARGIKREVVEAGKAEREG